MQNIYNSVKSSGLKVAEFLTPVLRESKFRETGVINPDEFVAAGDHLVHHCPSWQWAVGDPTNIKDYLPADKQFLITRNVPCYKRCQQMEYKGEEMILDNTDPEGGWVDTHHFHKPEDTEEKIAEMTLDEKGVEAQEDGNGSDEDEDALDMDDFIEKGGLEEDDNVVEVSTKPSSQGGEIVCTRTYDLNITYDKYYQTPRLWKPLTVEEMYEDFSADHANKTITMETHPHLPGGPQASVHPCKHAQTMKKLLDQITEGGGDLMNLTGSTADTYLEYVQRNLPEGVNMQVTKTELQKHSEHLKPPAQADAQ